MNSFPVGRKSRAGQAALLSVSIYAVVAGSPALAQPVNWTGFYAGLYAGGVWGRGKSSTSVADCGKTYDGITGGYFCDDSTLPASRANGNAVANAGSGSSSSGKFTGGIQAGRNWQDGNLVYGFEVDFGSFNVKGSRSGSGVFTTAGNGGGGGVNPGDAFTVSNSFSADWLFTARARLGWAVSNWIVFVTGGAAMSKVSVTNTYSDNHVSGGVTGTSLTVSKSKVRIGWTLGGGAEIAINKNWSIKGEYLYVDLGSVSTLGNVFHPNNPGYANALGVTTDLTAHVARLGANYKF